MDLLSLGVILLILAASGGIAFVADGLGKKIGKKRLSIRVRGWSMRPKHVASLGTVAMGVFVSALTIGFIMAVSDDARQWLLRGRKILADNQSLAQENSELQRTNLGFKAESDRLRSQNAVVKGANQKLADGNARLGFSLRKERADLEALNRQREGLLAERSRLGGQVRSLRVGLQGTRVALGESRASVGKVRLSLAFYQEAVRQAQGAVRVAQDKLDVAKKNYDFQFRQLQDALMKNLGIVKANTDLQIEVQKGEANVQDLETKRKGAEVAYDLALGQLNETQARLNEAQDQYAKLAETNAQLESANSKQADFLKGGFQTSRTQAMMFRRGEEVARVVVAAGADDRTAANVLASLLRVARIEAAARGAKGHRANGESFEAADIVDRKDPKTGDVLSADDLKRKIVAGLSGAREDQVLVATSSLNAFTGEVVSLDIAALPNPMVYRRNDTVAETQIDGGQAEDRILAELSEFYIGQVRERAVRDRMIPRAGNAAPFGGIPDAEVFNLVQTVKRAGRAVRVQAVAGDDIRAADLLRLEFRVR